MDDQLDFFIRSMDPANRAVDGEDPFFLDIEERILRIIADDDDGIDSGGQALHQPIWNPFAEIVVPPRQVRFLSTFRKNKPTEFRWLANKPATAQRGKCIARKGTGVFIPKNPKLKP